MKRNLKKFVDAGYKTKHEAQNIDNYTLDKDLSTKRNKVYYDPNTGKAVHTIAGTDTLKDWSNNALIPLGLHQYSNRYKNSEKIQKKANAKYGKSNVDLVTHSQSGNIAESLANKNLVGGENTTLNPAIIGSHNKNVKVVKSILDPVSLLTNTAKNDVKIIPKTINPITEHSTNILDKTQHNVLHPIKKMFGFGLNSTKIQSILFKRPEWKLTECKKWLKKHGYKTDVDKKPEHYRFRQLDPEMFEKYRTKKIGDNIEFIIGLKNKSDNKSMKYRSEDESEGSTSEEEEEHELKGSGILHEQDIIDRMAKLSHDIHVHHQKHGIKKSIVKGFKLLGKGIMHSAVVKPSMKGGKINRSKKFNSWFKDIGNKFKPLNKNLSPIKHQLTQSAVDNIAYQTMTPEQQAQAGVDMFSQAVGAVKGKTKTATTTPVAESYNSMYEPIIAQPVTESAYGGYYNEKMPYDFNSSPDSYARSYQPSQMSGFGLFDEHASKDVDFSRKGAVSSANYASSHQRGFGVKGRGATGKMLKNTAANATANLINAGSSRAVNEMETRNTTGKGLKKGSEEMKERMAKMRAMRKCNKA